MSKQVALLNVRGSFRCGAVEKRRADVDETSSSGHPIEKRSQAEIGCSLCTDVVATWKMDICCNKYLVVAACSYFSECMESQQT